jgi:outer membrane lipoprotein carrier protein
MGVAMHLLRLLLVSSLLLCAGRFAGAADDLSLVMATLEQGAPLLTDLQADFTQRATIPGVGGETKGKGQVLLKKGKEGAPLFRFDYSKPKQTIVSNGKTVWFYLPENRQVLVTDTAALMAGDSAMAVNLLSGLGKLSQDFTARLAGGGRDSRGNYLLELTPRRKGAMYSKLQLTVAAEAVEAYRAGGKATDPFPLRASTVHDTAGGRTTLEFANIRTNRGINSSRFTFRPPEGVEVIKQ